jgi:hypothetical protein
MTHSMQRLSGTAMRTLMTATALSLLATAHAAGARGDTHVFFVENHRDGYGVDQCLASGAHCGTPVANAYCQSRNYDHAITFRKVDPGEITGGGATDANCHGGSCNEYVAIECVR